MSTQTLNPLVVTYDPTPNGRQFTLNGMDLSWNIAKGGVEIAYDRDMGASIVTVRFVVDDLRVTSTRTEPIPLLDPEEFCTTCCAPTESSVHVQKCGVDS